MNRRENIPLSIRWTVKRAIPIARYQRKRVPFRQIERRIMRGKPEKRVAEYVLEAVIRKRYLGW